MTSVQQGLILSTAQRRAKMFKVENKTTGEVEICESMAIAELMVTSFDDKDKVFINGVQYKMVNGWPVKK